MKVHILYLLFVYVYFAHVNNVHAESAYKVKHGDSLWKIALNHGIELEIIIENNPQVSNPHLIFPGEIITIPGASLSNRNVLLSDSEKGLLELANTKRKMTGLKPLILDYSLTNAARLKSKEMMEKEYVSHISPSYGDSTTMLKTLRIPFNKVKECIGAGNGSPNEIFSLWMNSTVNQSSILDKLSTHIGIGHVAGGLHGHYWTVIIIQRAGG